VAGKQAVFAGLDLRVALYLFGGVRLDVAAVGYDVVRATIQAVGFDQSRARHAQASYRPPVTEYLGHGVTFKKSGMERSSEIAWELSATRTGAGSAGEVSSTSGAFGNRYPPSRLTGGSVRPMSVPAPLLANVEN